MHSDDPTSLHHLADPSPSQMELGKSAKTSTKKNFDSLDFSPTSPGSSQRLRHGLDTLQKQDPHQATTLLMDDINLDAHRDEHLWGPLRQMSGRTSKHFRKRLVQFGFQLVQNTSSPMDPPDLEKGGDLLEMLHLGSLIIDDIQDDSLDRRGGPTLHRLIGMPRALCAGNFLYFKAFNMINDLVLTAEEKLYLFESYGETMEKAHLGQMLDLSIKASTIPEGDLPHLCEKISMLKTGCLTALAMKLGAVMGKATPHQLHEVTGFGLKYGILLQYCDDIGNITVGKTPSKRFEDLRHDKPTSLWSLVYRLDKMSDLKSPKTTSPKHKSLFLSLRDLAQPAAVNTDALITWLSETHFLNKTRRLLQNEIIRIFTELQRTNLLSSKTLAECQTMTEELLDAYTN